MIFARLTLTNEKKQPNPSTGAAAATSANETREIIIFLSPPFARRMANFGGHRRRCHYHSRRFVRLRSSRVTTGRASAGEQETDSLTSPLLLWTDRAESQRCRLVRVFLASGGRYKVLRTETHSDPAAGCGFFFRRHSDANSAEGTTADALKTRAVLSRQLVRRQLWGPKDADTREQTQREKQFIWRREQQVKGGRGTCLGRSPAPVYESWRCRCFCI